MSKSATALGQEYGLTAREMNFVLREEGFLGGEPGNYTVTEKGENLQRNKIIIVVRMDMLTIIVIGLPELGIMG